MQDCALGSGYLKWVIAFTLLVVSFSWWGCLFSLSRSLSLSAFLPIIHYDSIIIQLPSTTYYCFNREWFLLCEDCDNLTQIHTHTPSPLLAIFMRTLFIVFLLFTISQTIILIIGRFRTPLLVALFESACLKLESHSWRCLRGVVIMTRGRHGGLFKSVQLAVASTRGEPQLANDWR